MGKVFCNFKRFKCKYFQYGECLACLVRLCNAKQLVPLRLTSGYEQLYKLCPSRLCLQVTSLAETNSQLGHRGRVALDSKNRPPVALIESRKTIGPQRRLSSSGERYADLISNFLSNSRQSYLVFIWMAFLYHLSSFDFEEKNHKCQIFKTASHFPPFWLLQSEKPFRSHLYIP